MNHLLRAGKKEQNGYARYCYVYYYSPISSEITFVCNKNTW